MRRLTYVILTFLAGYSLEGVAQTILPGHAGSITNGSGKANLYSATAVTAYGNYLYVVGQDALEILDVSNPYRPVHMSSILDDDNGAWILGATSIFVDGHYAYIASGWRDALEIIDISNPRKPVHVTNITNGENGASLSYPTSVYVDGHYAYVTSYYEDALEILDISKPATPRHVSVIGDGTGGAQLYGPMSVVVKDSIAYVASAWSNALEVIDVHNPAKPRHKAALLDGDGGAMLGYPQSLTYFGDFLYVASTESAAMEIINISDPAHPTHVAAVIDGDNEAHLLNAVSVHFDQGVIYVATGESNGVQLIDVTDPTAPVVAGSVFSGTDGAVLDYAYGVYVQYGAAFVVSNSSDAVEILDVTDISHPFHLTTVKDGDFGALLLNPSCLAITGAYAFVMSDQDNTMEVIDVSNPALPVHIAGIKDGQAGIQIGGPSAIAIEGNYAYILNADYNSVEIVDITDPANPVSTGRISDGENGAMLNFPYAIAISGTTAYVASYLSDAVEVIDITDPAFPVHLTSVLNGDGGATLVSPTDIQVVDNYLYVATSNALEILDLTDPTAPVHAAALSDGDGGAVIQNPNAFVVNGGFVYIANPYSLEVIDVQDPLAPAHSSLLEDQQGGAVLNYCQDIAVSQKNLLITTYFGSALEVVDISNPAVPVHHTFVANGQGNALLYNPFAIAVVDGYAFVTSIANSGLEILSLYVSAPPLVLDALPGDQSYSFTIQWNQVPNADGYFIDVSDSYFNSYVLYNVWAAGSTTSYEVKNLSPITEYQFRIRSYNKNGTSPNSNIVTTITAPNIPYLNYYYLDDALATESSFFPYWSEDSDATSYFIDVSLTRSFRTLLPGYDNLEVPGPYPEIDGLDQGTTYYFRVRSHGVGGTSPSSEPAVAFTNFAPPVAKPATEIKATAFQANWTPIKGSVGYHLTVSDDNFESIVFEDSTVQNAVTVPNLNPNRNYQYRVTADFRWSPTEVSTSDFSDTIHVTTLPLNLPGLAFGGTLKDYRIISVPMVLPNANIEDVFSPLLTRYGGYKKDKWRLIQYQEGKGNVNYTEGLAKIEQGKGYWFNALEAVEVPVKGTLNPSDNFTLELVRGWNQIGNPYNFPISWQDVLALNPGATGVSGLYTYEPATISFTASKSVLQPWQGAFVYADADEQLTIPRSIKQVPAGRMQNTLPDGWLVQMRLQQGESYNDRAGFGMSRSANPDEDIYDRMEIPRFLKYLELNTTHPQSYTPYYTTDVVPESRSAVWNFRFESNFGPETCTLTWSLPPMPAEAQLWLVDEQSGATVNMREQQQLQFDGHARLIRIHYAATAAELMLTGHVLGSPYPNPTDGETLIPIMLATDEVPELEVLDMKGQRMTVLAPGALSKGGHTISWNAHDNLGSRLAPGLYLIRMRTRNINTVQTRKIIIK